MIKREGLNNLLARVVAISVAFFIKLNKVKKALKFLMLRVANGSNRTSIISASILSKFLLFKSLSELDSISSKFSMYLVAFLSKL